MEDKDECRSRSSAGMLSHDELLDRGEDDDEADDDRSDSAGVQKESEWESLWS